MTKKTIIKFVYFTIILLLPIAPIFLGLNSFAFFLKLPRLYGHTEITSFGTVIFCISVMSINFFIAYLLHNIHRKKSIAGISFFIMVGIIVGALFIAPALGVTDGLIVFFFPFGTFMQFCPLYFFGILIYHRYINPFQYISNIKLTGKTDSSITVEVQFPVSCAYGNELTVIKIGRFSGASTTTANGTYTITGLNPQTNYTVVMKWLENGVSKTQKIRVETLSLQQYIDAQEDTSEEIEQCANSGGVLHKENQTGLSSTEVDGQGVEESQ